LKKGYNRLVEREDAWIMEARRMTISQVALYLGAWISVVGAALIVLFNYKNFEGALKVAIAAAAAFPMAYIGVRCWSRGLLRTAIAFLLAFCFLWPIVLLVAMGEYGLLSSQPDPMLEFFPVIFGDYFREITNAQLFWGFLLSLPASLWLRRFTVLQVLSCDSVS
jgi:hypothetical protein